MPHRLVARDLACGYDAAAPTLRGVDLRIGDGETVVLVGPSGCGKTTLLKTLAGLLPPLHGEVATLDAVLPERPTRGHLGYVPQGLGLVRHVSVLRNVLMGTLPATGLLRSLTWSREAVAAAREALHAVGLAAKAEAKPIHLSGGERRRVAVARALAQRPRLLLADEMLSEIDVATQRVVLDALARLQREEGTAVLLVEHNLDVAWDVADELVCLKGGGVAARFAPDHDHPEQLRKVMAVAR